MANVAPQKDFVFVGNHPCLDFINTELVMNSTPTDLLERFEDLVDWLVKTHTLSKKEAEARSGELRQDHKIQILAQAKTFRTTLRRMVEHIVNENRVPESAVTAINQLLRACSGYRELARTRSNAFKEVFIASADSKDAFLASLAIFASDLLRTADLTLIKKCKNPACVLYFYDTTKNHARNWCSMQLCGNREKVAAYFRRKRQNRT
ncbi:MAG TPA: ABATE domain-containing protein [Nitrospira sp.]|nr:ABATE domain-containing protein [Nitrospira sp.]